MAEGRSVLERVKDRLVYQLTWLFMLFVGLFYLKTRVSGVSSVPRHGGVLLLANHQSYMDPLLLGVSLSRPLKYTARSTLFRGFLAALIRSLGAIPLNREGVSLATIKELLGVVHAGEALVYFPEGTRTEDGELAPLKKGAGLVVRRSQVPVVIVGLAGAFEAWPRSRPIPGPGLVWIHYQAWDRSMAASDREEDVLASLEAGLREAFATARRHRERMVHEAG